MYDEKYSLMRSKYYGYYIKKWTPEDKYDDDEFIKSSYDKMELRDIIDEYDDRITRINDTRYYVYYSTMSRKLIIQNGPIDWYSKEDPKSNTMTYVADFDELRVAKEFVNMYKRSPHIAMEKYVYGD